MNIIVDTNIVFSTLLNPKSTIGELLMNVHGEVKFFAPELLLEEIERYQEKIEIYTKLDFGKLKLIKSLVLNTIEYISEELISEESWKDAYQLTGDIDENDTPFVALSLELKGKLWTGDKKLIQGLGLKKTEITISTEVLRLFLDKE